MCGFWLPSAPLWLLSAVSVWFDHTFSIDSWGSKGAFPSWVSVQRGRAAGLVAELILLCLKPLRAPRQWARSPGLLLLQVAKPGGKIHWINHLIHHWCICCISIKDHLLGLQKMLPAGHLLHMLTSGTHPIQRRGANSIVFPKACKAVPCFSSQIVLQSYLTYASLHSCYWAHMPWPAVTNADTG